jgi:hypothetical protein
VGSTTGLDDMEKMTFFDCTKTRTPTRRSSRPWPVAYATGALGLKLKLFHIDNSLILNYIWQSIRLRGTLQPSG